MKVRDMCRKFECREDIHYKTQTRTSCDWFATGPGLGLIMYIFTTLEFPTHISDFHLKISVLPTAAKRTPLNVAQSKPRLTTDAAGYHAPGGMEIKTGFATITSES